MVRLVSGPKIHPADDPQDALARRRHAASELQRRMALDATDRHIEELAKKTGEPGARRQAWADAIVRRIRNASPRNAS